MAENNHFTEQSTKYDVQKIGNHHLFNLETKYKIAAWQQLQGHSTQNITNIWADWVFISITWQDFLYKTRQLPTD